MADSETLLAFPRAVLAGRARRWLVGRPHRLERLGGTGGRISIGLGTRLALTGRRD